MRSLAVLLLASLAMLGCNKSEPSKPVTERPAPAENSAEVSLDTPEKKAIAEVIANDKDLKELKPIIVGLDIDRGWALARIESTTTVADQAKVLLRLLKDKWVILTVGTDLSGYSDTDKVRDDLIKKWGL